MSAGLRLFLWAMGLYASFLSWGWLQERITAVEYVKNEGTDDEIRDRWTFSFTLNTIMSFVSFIVAFIIRNIIIKEDFKNYIPHKSFIYPAISLTLASPLGYASLYFINFPMLLLAKSCKLIPVMIMGSLISGKSYTKGEKINAILITIGVALFSIKSIDFFTGLFDLSKPPKDHHAQGDEIDVSEEDALIMGYFFSDEIKQFIGLSLVLGNLILDGYTNTTQDSIYKNYKISSWYMMERINLWCLIIMTLWLIGGFFLFYSSSELMLSINFMLTFPTVIFHIIIFSICCAAGQICIFHIMKEFGSLVSVTLTLIRKFFSILISVISFNHQIQWWQWIGVTCVFLGLSSATYLKAKAQGKKKGD